jgi:hypothetical protein
LEEVVLISVFVGIAVIWGVILMPLFQTGAAAGWFASLNPVAQYFLYNSGLILSMIFSTGLIFELFRGHVHWGGTILAGLGMWILIGFSIDMYEAPLFLAPDGSMTYATAADAAKALAYTSVDAMLAWIYGSLGASGPWLYYLVYLITPIVAYAIAVLLLRASWIYRTRGIEGE